MIQIISGTYGYRHGGVIIALDAASAPVELDPSEEERLVEQGVAEYVDDIGSDSPPLDPSLDMSRDELNAIAAEYGIDGTVFTKKSQVLDAIKAAMEDEKAEQSEGK